jgi:hypothetical protein
MTLTIKFNENSTDIIQKAKQDLGLNNDADALQFALFLLNLAAAAKKQGRNIAVVQDMLVGNEYSTTMVDMILNLKGMSHDKNNSGIDISTFSAKGSHFIAPKF